MDRIVGEAARDKRFGIARLQNNDPVEVCDRQVVSASRVLGLPAILQRQDAVRLQLDSPVEIGHCLVIISLRILRVSKVVLFL